MPQGEHIELHRKRYGRQLDHEERTRKKEARSVKKRASMAQRTLGIKGKMLAKERAKEKVRPAPRRPRANTRCCVDEALWGCPNRRVHATTDRPCHARAALPCTGKAVPPTTTLSCWRHPRLVQAVMKKTIAMHEERDKEKKADDGQKGGAVPAYLLEREQVCGSSRGGGRQEGVRAGGGATHSGGGGGSAAALRCFGTCAGTGAGRLPAACASLHVPRLLHPACPSACPRPRLQVERAKVLSNTIKQKRKEKAGKWEVPLPKVRPVAEDEMFKVLRTGKRKKKEWKRMVTKVRLLASTIWEGSRRYQPCPADPKALPCKRQTLACAVAVAGAATRA